MAKGLLMDDETINTITQTAYGANPELRKKLRQDRKEAIIGLTLLWAGFVLQFIDELILLIT